MQSNTKKESEGKPRQLQTLNQVPLLPNFSSSRDQNLCALERIESIEVSEMGERDGRTVFIMDVFMHQARVLLASCPPPSTTSFLSVMYPDRKPDFRVARRYSEFITLSAEVYKHAFGHYAQRCQFCERIVQNIASGPTIATKLISSKETKLKHLTTFMQLLLRLALIRTDSQRPCKNQISIQTMVYGFIQTDE